MWFQQARAVAPDEQREKPVPLLGGVMVAGCEGCDGTEELFLLIRNTQAGARNDELIEKLKEGFKSEVIGGVACGMLHAGHHDGMGSTFLEQGTDAGEEVLRKLRFECLVGFLGGFF